MKGNCEDDIEDLQRYLYLGANLNLSFNFHPPYGAERRLPEHEANSWPMNDSIPEE